MNSKINPSAKADPTVEKSKEDCLR
jgi:hypothetical protein